MEKTACISSSSTWQLINFHFGAAYRISFKSAGPAVLLFPLPCGCSPAYIVRLCIIVSSKGLPYRGLGCKFRKMGVYYGTVF
jgi:hypothetical protein